MNSLACVNDMSLYVGIDVAFAKKKRLPVCVWQKDGTKLEPLSLRHGFRAPPRGQGNKALLNSDIRKSFVNDVVKWLHDLEKDRQCKICRIAIDAPRKAPVVGRRHAEQSLDSKGISCFTTLTKDEFSKLVVRASEHIQNDGKESNIPGANQLWMLIGFDLFEALENEKFDCIEVYPQATVKVLGCCEGHKTTEKGFGEQVSRIAEATGHKDSTLVNLLNGIGFGTLHDKLDAFQSAWIASLPEEERTPYGRLPDDVIWVPKLKKC